MLEFPEAISMARQLNANVVGRRVKCILPPTKAHKFCFFLGDPDDYDARLRGAAVAGAEGFGIFAELAFDNGLRLCWNDGVNARLGENAPKDYQLALEFEDGAVLSFNVAMYGALQLHDGGLDNPYYLASKKAASPLAPEFRARFDAVRAAGAPALSAKAFLATEQRFPGIGNGVLQDILFDAGIHPKQKIGTLDRDDLERLFQSVVCVLRDMTERGGRDTEKDLFGSVGGYATRLSRRTLALPCPRCGGAIAKESYLGGAVYYCPVCQPLKP